MILRIEIEQNGNAWKAQLTSPDVDGWAVMERGGWMDAAGYPLPPETESATWSAASAPLCKADFPEERKRAYNRFLRGDPRAGAQDVEALGGYLFALLLGGAWATVVGPAEAKDAIRIQLFLPNTLPNNPLWWQLPWELMVGEDSRPLAIFRRIVSVTRVVDSSQPTGVLSIEIPIRVLFVVGREIDNQLRPGAEYISLLRQLRCTIYTGSEARGIALHARLLMETTTEDLEAAVAEFKPSVVHIISHGQVANNASVLLLTKYEGSARKNPKTDPVDVARLADLLHAAEPEKRPSVVLLNACNTAQIGDVHASFVGDLVRRGIPLALGMAGEVADAASRLFAIQFYTALADQQPLDIAAAEGRRAALLHFKNYPQNFDWGRAVFCQAKDARAEIQRIPMQKNLLEAAERLRPKGNVREAFCGRYRWLATMYDVCRRQVANLAIGTDEELTDSEDEDRCGQLGKSRLLAEIAFQSVLEAWAPVHISQKRERFLNMMHWAVNLFEYLEKARETFGLARRHDSEVVKRACEVWGVPGYTAGQMQSFTASRDRVIASLQPQQRIQDKVPFDTIVLLLRQDFDALRVDIEAAVGPRRGILLLWDQLDDDDALSADFIGLLGPYGLGTSTSPVPVVFTYATRSAGGKRIIKAYNDNSNVEARRLAPFDAVESGMAVRQFVAWRKYVPNRSKLPDFEAAMQEFEEMLEGYPSKLYNFDQGMRVIARTEIIMPFDGAAIIEESR